MNLIYGNINNLQVIKETDISYTLSNGIDTVFLHFNQTPKKLKIGDKVKAFLYFDQKKRLCATLEKPLITSTKPGFVKVVDICDAGVFVNIGIAKDILVSKDFLPDNKGLWPSVDDELPCIIKVKTNQLVAKPLSTEDHFNKELPNVKDKLSGTVVSVNQNGIQVCTNDFKVCFINKNLLRDTYKVGQVIDFHIISIKGNLLYGSTGANKEKARLGDSEVILNYLRNMGGSLPLGNLSTPEEIYKKLHISKSAFKRAVGHLYKLKLITIEDYLITLNE